MFAEASRSAIQTISEHIKPLIDGGAKIRVDGPKGNETSCYMNIWIGRICLRASARNNVVNSARDARLEMVIIDAEVDPWGNIENHTELYRDQYSLFVTTDDQLFWKGYSDQLLSNDDVADYWLSKLSELIN